MLDTEHERPQVYLLLGDILARERHFAGAAEQKKFFLTIVPDADDTDEIKEQIKILEDLSKRKEKVGVTSINYNKLRPYLIVGGSVVDDTVVHGKR
jgi:hypothetical protein